ncbi:AAA family ATPase, partial [bacterium]|nr:AAA family ATPase [bacterium]
FLTKAPTQTRRAKFVIVDEASNLGTKQLYEVFQRTSKGDKILLIGDTKQHSSISSGAPFAKFQQHQLISTERMQENIRQKDALPFLEQAVAYLGQKQVTKAFELLDKHKRIVEIEAHDERLAKVADKYARLSMSRDTLAITETNREREQLNLLIRERLIDAKRLDEHGTTIMTLQPKRAPLAERNVSHAYETGDHFFLSEPVADFKKGSLGEIISIDHDKNTLRVRITAGGKARNASIDLTTHGHHLSTYTSHEKVFAPGERILFLKNDSQLGVQNGQAGTIMDMQSDGMVTVKTQNQETLSFNVKDYGFLDYGYARTSYVQGLDADSVIYNADTRHGLSFNSFYVAGTRAKEDLHIFTNDKQQFLAQSHVEKSKSSTLDYVSAQPSQAPAVGLGLGLGMGQSSTSEGHSGGPAKGGKGGPK